ncbi:MAG: phage tail protein [Anaerolineae bacterium]|nr:phage tail protein [Anaerolineae bacterium]MCO5188062.1 phage tail protein [Anaerolineae bacterium]MCO5192104.1 phage tail protein [Anaerolineae bacterium]MCO5204331.1 phage tail protein [Anaerolineae bacterium]
MPSRRTELDHVGAYNFSVEISGVNAGYFKSVSGLSAELEVLEFQDGDDLFLRKRPGRAKFGNVTLTKGYIVTQDLQDWWRAARNGQYDRRDVSIILKDNAGGEIRRWNLYGCWPCKWETNALVGNSNTLLEETITLVVEDMQIA